MAISPGDYWNPYTETLPREQIDRLQVKNFRQLAVYAKAHCAFYRHLYRDVDVQGIRSLADIRALPLVEKENLRQARKTRTRFLSVKCWAWISTM